MIHLFIPTFDSESSLKVHPEIIISSEQVFEEYISQLEESLKGQPYKTHHITLKNYVRIIDAINIENDIVVNLCDGIETDGYPGISIIRYLELKQIKFTGADSYFYSLERIDAKYKLIEGNVNTPSFILINSEADIYDIFDLEQADQFAWIMKLPNLYASCGISKSSIIFNAKECLLQYQKLISEFETNEVILERFIPGREFTVLCITKAENDSSYTHVFEPIERVFSSKNLYEQIITFEEGQTTHLNSSINYDTIADSALIERLKKATEIAYQILGGQGYGRADIRLDQNTDEIYLLEMNANPGIGLESTCSEILKLNNLTLGEFLKQLLDFAKTRGESMDTKILEREFIIL